MSHSAESLKATLSEPNRRRVELKLAEMSERWSELNVVVLRRIAETKPLLKEVEGFWEAAKAFKEWLEEQERRMTECGSIGTDESRLVEQAKILDVRADIITCTCMYTYMYMYMNIQCTCTDNTLLCLHELHMYTVHTCTLYIHVHCTYMYTVCTTTYMHYTVRLHNYIYSMYVPYNGKF